MRYYAEWLDGEYDLLKYLMSGYDHYKVILRSIRFHALLGSTLVLSDSQIVDEKTPLPMLFQDPDFRAFLRENPNFLALVADPAPDIHDAKFAIAARGLERKYRQQGKPPDSFEEASTQLYKAIRKRGSFDINEFVGPENVGRGQVGRVLGRFPNYREQLLGVLHALDHFTTSSCPNTTMASVSHPEGYDTFLHGVQSSVSERHAGRIQEILRIQREKLPEDQWGRRAAIRKVLGKGRWQNEPWKKHDLRLYLDVVHAWNYDINQTIAPEAGTLYESQDDLPLSKYERSVTDSVDWFRPDPKLLTGLPPYLRSLLSWDPLDTDWKHIASVVAETQETASRLQSVLKNGTQENRVNAIEAHARRMAGLLVDVHKTKQPHWYWDFARDIAKVLVDGLEIMPSELIDIGIEAKRDAPFLSESLQRRSVVNTVTKAVAKHLPISRQAR